jgi:hypothetical protein
MKAIALLQQMQRQLPMLHASTSYLGRPPAVAAALLKLPLAIVRPPFCRASRDTFSMNTGMAVAIAVIASGYRASRACLVDALIRSPARRQQLRRQSLC